MAGSPSLKLFQSGENNQVLSRGFRSQRGKEVADIVCRESIVKGDFFDRERGYMSTFEI